MSIVIRTNGNESYSKPDRNTIKALIKRGLFKEYDDLKHGYVNTHSDCPTWFSFKNKLYKLEYFSGCFLPFLLKINKSFAAVTNWIPNKKSKVDKVPLASIMYKTENPDIPIYILNMDDVKNFDEKTMSLFYENLSNYLNGTTTRL